MVDGTPRPSRGCASASAALPEAAAYYERIRLGELVAAEVEQRARARHGAGCSSGSTARRGRADASRPHGAEAAVNVAFLVERDRLDEFAARCASALQDELGGARCELRCVGPLPPYSFADDDVRSAAWA